MTEGQNPREAIRAALTGALSEEQLRTLFDEVLDSKKEVHVTCTKCNKKTTATVPDAKAVVGALAELVEQGFGRPGSRPEDDNTIVFYRTMIYSCECGEPCKKCEDKALKDAEAEDAQIAASYKAAGLPHSYGGSIPGRVPPESP